MSELSNLTDITYWWAHNKGIIRTHRNIITARTRLLHLMVKRIAINCPVP